MKIKFDLKKFLYQKIHQIVLLFLFVTIYIELKSYLIVALYILLFIILSFSYLRHKIKLLFLKIFFIFIRYFHLICVVLSGIYIYILFKYVSSFNIFFHVWSNMTYQDFGFVKRLLIPSFFKLFPFDTFYMYNELISFFLIFSIFYLLISYYKDILKNHNFFVFFLIFLIFFLSPFSINRFLTIYIINDGLNFALFIISFLLILKFSSIWIYFLVSILSVIAILNHETYIAFFPPILFSIAKYRKASISKLFTFSVPIIIAGLFIALYGRVEQFSHVNDFQKFSHSINIENGFLINSGLCNYYPSMPFYVTIKENIEFTKCMFYQKHFFSIYFYFTLLYLFLFIYRF